MPSRCSRRLDEADDPAHGVDLDEFYRRCLADGVDYHCGQGRGLLPAGLVEEIRALTEPPAGPSASSSTPAARWTGGRPACYHLHGREVITLP